MPQVPSRDPDAQLDVRHGCEWVIDAYGCRSAPLCDATALQTLLDNIVREVGLNLAVAPVLHTFDGPGGVTALYLLQESHLACHTFPEHGYASFNLYCCTPRPPWPWRQRLADALGATEVVVRQLQRGLQERPL